MITYDAVEANLRMAHMLLHSYLEDFTDEELLVRPVAGANHAAWQLGHLIWSEYSLISQVADQVEMAAPVGWANKYTNETAEFDDPMSFESKDRYLELYDAQRQATLDLFQTLPEDQLEEVGGPEPLQKIAQNVGQLFLFQAHHELMHAGQFTCIRRKLEKPTLF